MSATALKSHQTMDFKALAIQAQQLKANDGSAVDMTELTALTGKTGVVATAKPTVTYTTGSAPTVTGSQTIANSATPTVVELLKLIYEIQAKLVTAGVLS